jgi:hypothetical protein
MSETAIVAIAPDARPRPRGRTAGAERGARLVLLAPERVFGADPIGSR